MKRKKKTQKAKQQALLPGLLYHILVSILLVEYSPVSLSAH